MKQRWYRSISSLALGVTLAGCAVGPDFKQPAAPAATRYTAAELPVKTDAAPGLAGAAQTFDATAALPAQWWTLFHSEQLNQLITLALQNSPTLAAAQGTLRQAQEGLIAERGSLLWPAVSASLQGSRQKESPITTGVPGGELFNLYNASVNVSYSVDLFGSSRRQIEAAGSLVDYQREELEATYLTLVSNVVTTAIREASLRAQIQVTREILDAQTHQVDLIDKQFQFGAVPKSSLLSQQVQVAQTRATLPPLEKQLSQTRHLLAVLVGKTPSEATLPEFTLEGLTLPESVPVSLPADMVRQRPDVRAAEALLHQASANVGVATANLYPQLGLSASYGSEALSPHELFMRNFNIWSIAAGLTQPIFNGGALSARRRSAQAALDTVAAQYRVTVLQAFENVADSLRALEFDATAVKANADAESLSHTQLDLVTRQYKIGAISYLPLLDAERQYQQSRVLLVQAQAARLADTAALFQSLGGGWWSREAPIAPVVLVGTN